jgi:hypothetical protein
MRSSAAVARRAHNPKLVGSTPTSAKHCEDCTHHESCRQMFGVRLKDKGPCLFAADDPRGFVDAGDVLAWGFGRITG